ncbi:MAG TPA: protein phosphatase 2C domain-containing protein [Longimicrobium sp.]|nr:protein phosphatase 2C domain-containing protein [Longimicrobium sp.]
MDDGSPDEDAATQPAWNTVVAPAAPVEEGAGEVVFTPPAGSYHPPVNLFLTCATRDAEIRYTQDGGEPGPGSALYERGMSLLLTTGATVRARAFAPGMRPGPVASHEYALQAPQWRVVEPDGGPDPVPHQVHHWVPEHAPGWSLAAASTRGRLHAHRGEWREDACAFARHGAWSILAVSDGAGSASLSRVGSVTVCERAVEELRIRLPEHPPRAAGEESLKAESLPALRAQLANAGRAALNGLREAAATRGQPVEAFAATLLLVVLCPWGGGYLAAALQVGDGQIALLTRQPDGHAVTLLGEADHGTHSAETRFLTTRGVEETLEHRVRFALPAHLEAVALMTDGISDDFFPEDRRLVELFTADSLPSMAGRDGAPLRGVLHGVTRSADPGLALAEWVEYERKGSSDDRTLLLLWARE